MKPFSTKPLDFGEAYAIADSLFEFGRTLHDEPKYAKPVNWILTYRYSIRAMTARIFTVDREYRALNMPGYGLAPMSGLTPKECNRWNMIWESYAGTLFFGMDSSLECLTHALNALGCLLKPGEFMDVAAEGRLRRITPANVLDSPTQDNARHSIHAICAATFPEICKHWSSHRSLTARVIEYHDATKHRHSAVVGQGPDFHVLKPEPKGAMGRVVFDQSVYVGDNRGAVPHDGEHTLQSITTEYRDFMVAWLQIAARELAAVFGMPLPEQSK